MSRLKMSAETTVDSSRVEVPSFPESIPEGKGGEVCRKMLHYLNQKRVYLDRNLSLAKFSSIVGTNTTYLSNAVNQIFGCNLKSLLNWYRVQYAKRMLTCYTYKLKDIPFICGFSSKSTFYVAFRKYEGITPYQYVLERRPDRLEELEEVSDERTSKITAQPGLPSSQYAHT
jgi:AraC-like DNA-binding protein